MRCGAVLVVLCLVAGLGFQNETFSEEKVVYTDDFERSPLDRGLSAASPPATEWASGEGHSGTRSIKIHAKPGENIKWTMKVSIPVKKDVRHRVSFWAKCDPVYDHWGANFDVGTSRGEGCGIGYVTGKDGWRQWHIFFTPRRSDKITSFTFGLAAENDLDPKRWGYETGEMTVYFDDVTVVETGVDMSEVPDKVKIGGDEHQPLIEKRILSNHSWGEMVPEFEKAVQDGKKGWAAAVLDRADRCLAWEQFYPDGGQIECSPHYHEYCMRCIFRIVELARSKAIHLPEGFTKKLPGAILDFQIYTLTPQLRIPLVGDNSSDHIGDLPKADRLFPRDDLKWVLSKRKEGAPPKAGSVAFPDTGFYVMRTGWEPDAHYLLFRCLPGRGQWIWHHHRDQLTFLLYAYGQPVIMERSDWGDGTGSGDQGVTDDFRKTEHHNCMMLDGKQQNYLEATCHAWVSNDDVDFADGSHPGYLNATSRRRIFFIKPRGGSEGYWVMSDRVSVSGSREVKEFLHFAPTIELSTSEDKSIIYAIHKPGKAHLVPDHPGDSSYVEDVPAEQTPRSGVAVFLRDLEGQPWEFKEEEALVSIMSCDSSNRNSPKHCNIPSRQICWARSGELPFGSHQVFYPFKDREKKPSDVKIERVDVTGAGADACKVARGGVSDLFCFALSGGERKYGDVSFDGTAAFLRTEGGGPTRLCIVGGKLLAAKGLSVTCSGAASFSLILAGMGWELVAREPIPEDDVKIEVATALGKQELILKGRKGASAPEPRPDERPGPRAVPGRAR